MLNQASVDMFNAAVYGGSYTLSFMEWNGFGLSGKWWPIVWTISWISFTLSLYSSLLLYLAIAVERFLALCFPLWHRAHVRKKYVRIVIVTLWCLSALIALCRNLYNIYYINTGSHSNVLYEINVKTYNIDSILLIMLPEMITLLFIITVLRAFFGLQSPPGQSLHNVRSNTHNARIKKQLRLTRVLFVMYFAFAAVNIPICLLVNEIIRYSPLISSIVTTLLLSTSVFNPSLTLFFKSEFRPRYQRPQRHNFQKHIHVRPVQARHVLTLEM